MSFLRAVWLGSLLSLTMLVGCGGGSNDTIVRVGRQNNSGTYDYFREEVLGKEREFKSGSLDQSGSKDVVELVSKTRSAIGYSGMGYATNEVKMLPVSKEPGGSATAPTMENAKAGTYPLARYLYVYTVGDLNPTLKHYIEWIHSEEGQAIVEQVGYVPVEATPMTITEPPADATIKVGGSDTMVNLAQAWAEKYSEKYPNVKVQVSGGGSGTGIAKLIEGTVDLANSSREMKEDERTAASQRGELKELSVAMDALAIYVHKDNPLTSISLKDLAEIYGDGGTITRWSQLGGSAQGGN